MRKETLPIGKSAWWHILSQVLEMFGWQLAWVASLAQCCAIQVECKGKKMSFFSLYMKKFSLGFIESKELTHDIWNEFVNLHEGSKQIHEKNISCYKGHAQLFKMFPNEFYCDMFSCLNMTIEEI